MSNQDLTLGEYSRHSTVGDIYERYTNIGTPKEIFYDWYGLNEWLFLKINGIRHDLYDQVMIWVSKAGDYKLFPYYLAALLGYVILSSFWQRYKKRGGVRARLVVWLGVFIVLSAGFVADRLMVHTVKNLAAMPRPYISLAGNPDLHQLEFPDADRDYQSFPSGHVAFITFLIISLWPAFRDEWKWHSLWLIALMGWSRVSLGVHFPVDAVGAFLMTGALIVWLRWFIYLLLRKLFHLHC